MTDHFSTDIELPDWTRKVTADDMVTIVRQVLEAEGRQTTRRGRAYLRAAYERHLNSSDRLNVQEISSAEVAARKLVELAKELKAFAGFSRAGYRAMENMVLGAERKATVTKVCPAWPFC